MNLPTFTALITLFVAANTAFAQTRTADNPPVAQKESVKEEYGLNFSSTPVVSRNTLTKDKEENFFFTFVSPNGLITHAKVINLSKCQRINLSGNKTPETK